MILPSGSAVGVAVDAGNHADEIERGERPDEIVADATIHQLAIEHDVVDAADDDDLRAGIAIFGEHVERLDELGPLGGAFDHDDIRRRRVTERLDGGSRAAHPVLRMRALHAAVGEGRLYDLRELLRFAEGLHGDARNRRDEFHVHVRGADHQLPPPTEPMLEFFTAQAVFGSEPLRTCVMARSLISVSGRSSASRRDEIAGIGRLRGHHLLRRAAEIPVGLVLPAFDGGAGAEVARPLAALVDLPGLDADERQPHRRGERGVGDRIGRDLDAALGATGGQRAPDVGDDP